MLHPLPMQRITLNLLREDAPRAALLLANYGNFDPESSETTTEQFPELPGESWRLAHAETRARLDKILAHYGLATPSTVAEPMHAVDPPQLAETGAWLKAVWDQCSEAQERIRRLHDEYRRTAQLYRALDQFMDISIDLARLQKQSALLDVRVGTLPLANLRRFEEALVLAGYVAIRFFGSEEQVHLILAGPGGQERSVEQVLQAAGWRTMEIPAEFHGHPNEVRRKLDERMAQFRKQQAQENERRREELAQDHLRERLIATAHLLARAAPYAELAGLMRGRGSLATVGGWIPKERLPQLERLLDKYLGNRYALYARHPRPGEAVPSAIRHHLWLQPFARLVLNYGVPRYSEIDPTVLFALSFVLMFGMMFGDVGQGIVIAVAGILMRRRVKNHAPLVVAIGISSTLFGMLYGSVFGYEHAFPALWMSPLSDPMRMLGVALGWGIGFILLATLLTIRNRIAAGRIREALLDGHGAAGLLLYLGLLAGAWRYASSGELGFAVLLTVPISIAAIFAHAWRHNPGCAIGERLLVALMESFESAISYISNTLSFLRLAAFSLNHVALSIAVFTVADMLDATGYWLTVVLGNIFILVLEGGIVAIQTLRLEYYEGFSRFFGGDGRPFRPLALGKPRRLAFQHR